MAISHDPVTAAPTGIDIEAPRANVTIEIPLDDDALAAAECHGHGRATVKARTLLKGKEGSRRRQRWENDRLLSNPYAQPPLPSDWEVRPTYPIHNVPYFLAPLWDAEYKAKAQAKITPRRANNVGDTRAHGSKEEQAAARVPRELREKLKKSRGAKNMLQDLEEEVRSFVQQWSSKERQMAEDDLVDGDSEDEEIVFVGRNGAMSDDRKRSKSVVSDDSSIASISSDDLAKERMILESLVDDRSAAFGRWLVHSIATYYGLETWSVTKGSPARREAYIGLKHKAAPAFDELPRPLYVPCIEGLEF
ncbi:unnamed protein product [Aureobasidium pullulans]|nr:unnamed protein product [Aureobasidium pullulans]